MYKAKPKVFGNPDRGQNPTKVPFGTNIKTLMADTIDQLKEAIWDWQIDNAIGAGNWGDTPVFKDNKLIGYMSYNGRIWDRNIWNKDAKEIK